MLFKHPEEKGEKKPEQPAVKAAVAETPPPSPAKDTSPAALRELIEKNLKWSQIIYEQNRKINSKLFWQAVANWLRLLLIVATFAIAAWFLPPLLGNLMDQYTSIISDPGAAVKSGTVNNLLKNLPLSPEQKNAINNYLQQTPKK